MIRGLAKELADLSCAGLAELRTRHQELFGEESRSKNLPFLRKKLAFRLQERVEGGVGPETRTQIESLMPVELPMRVPDPNVECGGTSAGKSRDPRLPEPGTILTREFRGVAHPVEVLALGFRYRGREYRSLSALARVITGTAWNGFTFFGLGKGGSRG